MSTYRNIRRTLIATAFSLSLAVPMLASATTITLSGTVNDGPAIVGDAGFNGGDSISGSFDVDLDDNNGFGLADLDVFTLNVGSLLFSLNGSDFVNFSGSLSNDGATVESFDFLSSFVPATGARPTQTFALAFDIDNPPFSITATSSDFSAFGIAEANLSANVANEGGVAVPEPQEMVIFAFAMALIGGGIVARRRRLG